MSHWLLNSPSKFKIWLVFSPAHFKIATQNDKKGINFVTVFLIVICIEIFSLKHWEDPDFFQRASNVQNYFGRSRQKNLYMFCDKSIPRLEIFDRMNSHYCLLIEIWWHTVSFLWLTFCWLKGKFTELSKKSMGTEKRCETRRQLDLMLKRVLSTSVCPMSVVA